MRNFSISEYIISVVELVEAQANDIRKSFEKSAGRILSLSIVVSMMILGLIFLILGLYALFKIWVGEVGAYFLTSLVSFLISFIIYGIFIWKTRW